MSNHRMACFFASDLALAFILAFYSEEELTRTSNQVLLTGGEAGMPFTFKTPIKKRWLLDENPSGPVVITA